MNKVIVDKARLLRRVIVISWISLAFCFVVKIFGGNFFEIICENPNYKAMCDYADSHFWLKYLIAVVSSIICQSFYTLAILKQYKFKLWQALVIYPSILISCFIKLTGISTGIVFDIWLTLGMPIVFLGKQYKRYISALIGMVLILAFQIISLFVKNLGLINVADSYFIGLIYMIDLYIMCILYYLYRNYQKENNSMGALWVFFAGKPVDKLKAMKAKRESKIKKLEAEIDAIELEISKKKNEK